ncbi:hypothetical protein, partial [Streptomyces sp. 900105755]
MKRVRLVPAVALLALSPLLLTACGGSGDSSSSSGSGNSGGQSCQQPTGMPTGNASGRPSGAPTGNSTVKPMGTPTGMPSGGPGAGGQLLASSDVPPVASSDTAVPGTARTVLAT